MKRVVDGLRQTPKGRLHYDRVLEGEPLTDLLHKCASAPALSSPHYEISPPRSGHSASFGLGPSAEEEEERTVSPSHKERSRDVHLDEHDYEEKGKLDSFETECSPKEWSNVLSLNISPKELNTHFDRTHSPEPGEGKVHLLSPRNGECCSKQGLNLTEDSNASFIQSGDKEEDLSDNVREELTVSFTKKLRIVHDVEKDWENKGKELREKKQLEFQEYQESLETVQKQLISVVEQRHRQDIEQQRNIVEKKHLSRTQEIRQAMQKVKESHNLCSRRQDARLKQVEQLGQHLKEEKVRKEQALQQRLAELRALAQRIAAIRTTLMSTLDNCPHKQYLSEAAEKTRLLVRKLSEQAEALTAAVDRSGPLDEISAKLKHFQEQSQNALDFVNSLTAEAEQKAKAAAAEAEKQKQQAQSAQQQPQQPQTSQGQGTLQSGQTTQSSQSAGTGEEVALAAVTKAYEDNIKLLSQTDAVLQPFVGNQQMKKTRFDLQKAVNIPVNAISPVSSAHLRDKLMRLRSLLKGETVEVSGKQVTAQAVPQGMTFCKNLTARMIARKGDEQVSSSHESAFAVAAVAVGLWAEFPDMGELLMGHLQALCPYVLPFYPPRLPNQSSADYHRTLGYKVDEDGTIEQQDKFLRRMSGILRLYAAILVTCPPQGANCPHPHGLEHAWIWLGRTMNMQPNPDITATAIYDILQVTGHFLLKMYRVQFVKLIYCLFRVYLPKLKEVAAGSGPVSRLETFLETTMRNNALIPEPEGYLPPRFWSF